MSTTVKIFYIYAGALLWLAASLYAGIIGNFPFDQMKTKATLIVAGIVTATSNSGSDSIWTIQTLRIYKGDAAPVIEAKANRPLSVEEAGSLRLKRGVFMVDANGSLLTRTGATFAVDYFVQISQDPVSVADNDVALCIDWMRGLANPGALIMRDLAVAADSCGSNLDTAKAIRAQFAGSPHTSDAMIGIFIGLRQSEPGALISLEQWLPAQKSLHPMLIENIAWAMFAYASPDPAGSASLRRLALGANAERIKGAAATVLAYIHSDETWLDLAALLTSTNEEVRWQATLGLLQAVDSGEREAPGPFGRKLFTSGKPVERRNKKRPAIPDDIRAKYALVGDGKTQALARKAPDDALIKFWLDYAHKNQ